MSPEALSGHVVAEVPGTCANLGPGFDAFAAAVGVGLRVRTIDRWDERVVTSGEGAGELPTDDDNLVWRALVAYCDRLGAAAPDISLSAHSELPLERGLGSSAAAAVAGLVLARALTGAGGSDQDLIGLGAELEGHPDNAAAAVLGGLVVSQGGVAHRLQPSERLRPILCVPAERQSTHAARGILPASVPMADAAANGARAAVVLAGLCGALAWEPSAMTDVLHEPARLELMAASGSLVRAVRTEGLGACLSGAGPAVLVIAPTGDDDAVERVRQEAGDGWCVVATRWDRAGAVVRAAGTG